MAKRKGLARPFRRSIPPIPPVPPVPPIPSYIIRYHGEVPEGTESDTGSCTAVAAMRRTRRWRRMDPRASCGDGHVPSGSHPHGIVGALRVLARDRAVSAAGTRRREHSASSRNRDGAVCSGVVPSVSSRRCLFACFLLACFLSPGGASFERGHFPRRNRGQFPACSLARSLARSHPRSLTKTRPPKRHDRLERLSS